MKTAEVWKIFDHYFKDDLISLGFRKIKNKYIYDINDDLRIEFNVQLDKWGWNVFTGASFVFSIIPIYKEWGMLDFGSTQLRFHEIIEECPKKINDISEIMNKYSKKIKYEESIKDYYKFLSKKWTKRKIRKNIGSWFFYYDPTDVDDWYQTLKPVIMAIIKKRIAHIEDLSIEDLNKSANNTSKMLF